MDGFSVGGFGLFSPDDHYDMFFDCEICWSRIYEYPFAGNLCSGRVHNTTWGFAEIHERFRFWLDDRFDAVHSDRRPNTGTEVWDITTPPRDEWLGSFDTLLCISTLEEVRGDHVQIMRDHFLPQLRPGGRMVVTFDLPGLQLEAVEEWVGQPCAVPGVPLTNNNSPRRVGIRELRVGFLVMTKET